MIYGDLTEPTVSKLADLEGVSSRKVPRWAIHLWEIPPVAYEHPSTGVYGHLLSAKSTRHGWGLTGIAPNYQYTKFIGYSHEITF